MLHKRYHQFDSTEVMHRAEELMSAASNRYRITVQVANRAKRRRYEDFEKLALSIHLPLPKTSTILVEMVYQIAVAYGFDNLENPAQKGEFLAIFAIALGSQQIMKLGLSFLAKHTPIHGLLIDATTNVILFQLLGYAANQFYEAKVKAISPLTSIEAYTTLEEKAKAYLQKAISQKEAVREVVADAVYIQKQLALA
jgi:hypothetical protein